MDELSPRERIITTAMRLFNEAGAHGVGVDRIIAESGVAKRTFYNHFPSKAVLLAEYFRRRDELWFSRMQAHTSDAGMKPLDRLLGIFDALKVWYGRPDFFGCSFIRGLSEFGEDCDSPELAVCIREHFERLENLVTTLVRPVRPDDYKEYVPRLMTMIVGSTVVAHATRDVSIADVNKRMAREMLAR